MSVVLRTAEFDGWLRALREPIGKARILARRRAAELGHFVRQAKARRMQVETER
jgi:hypothetical protein